MGGLFSRSSRGIRNSATASQSIASSSSTAVPARTTTTAVPAVPACTTTSPECEVLRLYSDKLVTAIKAADPLNLAIKLYANGLIGEETRDNVDLPIHTPHRKAHIIVSAVQRRVEADPSLFHQFTGLLQNEGDDILISLGRELEKRRFTLPPHNTPHQTKPTQPQSPLCLYANKLRSLYAQSELPRYSNPACYKWTPSPSKEYIDLSTIDRKSMTTQQVDEMKKVSLYSQINTITSKRFPYYGARDTIKLEEILQAKPGEKLECVLVEGAPGIGKSTLAWQLCNRWGKGELFQQYSTVLLLPLRDQRVQGAKCVEELFISTNTKLQDNVRREITQTNWDGKDTLIILEGLDELPSHLLSQPSIFTALLSGTELHQATILVTSRPSATEQLQKHWNQRISRHFVINGFTNRNIARYAQSVLSDHEQLSGFVEYASHFHSMLYVPLHCVIAVTIYLQCQQSRTPPPKTLTGLYTCLTQTILIQYLNDHPGQYTGECYTIFDLRIPHPVHNCFKELCRIAFEHLSEQQLVFTDMPKELHDLGFTDAIPELLLYQQSASYSYNFLHLSIQEFLAAYHVSLMSANEQEQLIKTEWDKSPFENMHRFLAGISKFKELNKLVARQAVGISESISEQSASLSDYSLEMLYECQDVNILDAEYTYNVTLRYPSPHHYLALGYCIANSSCGWNLELIRCNSEAQAEMILQGLKESKACHTSYSIKSIRCINCSSDFTHKVFAQHIPEPLLGCIESLDIVYKESLLARSSNCSFSRLPPHLLSPMPPCLPELILRMKRLGTLKLTNVCDTSITALIAALSRVPTLRNLSLSKLDSQWLPALGAIYFRQVESSIEHRGAQAMAEMLKYNTTLKELDIADAGVSNAGVVAMAEALHHNRTLVVLDMSSNTAGDRGALAMAEMLKRNTTLEELDITEAGVRNVGVVAMVEALHHNTTLRKLDLSRNPIKEWGAVAIAEMLKHNTALEELNFADIWRNIGSASAIAMAEALHHNRTLRKLDMSGNSVGERGALAMANMLKKNTTLEELNLKRDEISDKGIKALLKSLEVNQHLKKLTISNKYKEFVQYHDLKGRVELKYY